MATYDDLSLDCIPPMLQPGEREHVLIMQDETIFHTNEYRRRMWPGCVAVFTFNRSSAHEGFTENALNINNMNVNPSGKQRKLHDMMKHSLPTICGKRKRQEHLGSLSKRYRSAGGALTKRYRSAGEALTKRRNAPSHTGLGKLNLRRKPWRFPILSGTTRPLKHN